MIDRVLAVSDIETHGKLCCSFCGTSEDATDDLVAGPTVHICGDCIDLAHEIVQRARARRGKTPLALVPRTEVVP